MDSRQFARFIAALGRLHSQRRLLPAIAIAGLTAASLPVSQDGIEASKKGKRRRRRKDRPRKRCLNACGDSTCTLCVYAITGEIDCAFGAIAACAEDCQSDDDCSGVARCMTAAQEIGSATKERLCGGNFVHGICAFLTACPPP